MSWHYLRELEGESLVDICSDGEPLQPLKSKITHAVFYCKGKLMDSYLDSLFGTMLEPLMENPGEEKSKSSAVDFHARTYQVPAKGLELMESDQECGQKWQGSFTKYDPNTSSWKTHQCLLHGDLEEFSEIWPRWGLMQDGECWEQMPWDFAITEPESGWLPTPVTSDAMGAGRNGPRKGGNISTLKDYFSKWYRMAYPPVNITEYMMGWPIGWTDLKQLEMDKSLSVLLQPGNCLHKETND